MRPPELVLLIILGLGATVMAVRLVLKGRSGTENVASKSTGKTVVMQNLRSRLLNGTATEFKLQPDGTVWGVLMETGYPGATATLAALADGSASIYISTGGGVIGGGENPSVNATSRRFVHAASSNVNSFSAVTDFPFPTSGQVKFYVLTTSGVVSAEAVEEHLGKGTHPLSPLFFAGQNVITGLRELSEKRAAQK